MKLGYPKKEYREDVLRLTVAKRLWPRVSEFLRHLHKIMVIPLLHHSILQELRHSWGVWPHLFSGMHVLMIYSGYAYYINYIPVNPVETSHGLGSNPIPSSFIKNIAMKSPIHATS